MVGVNSPLDIIVRDKLQIINKVATAAVIPELEGLFDGMAIRVPTAVVSLSDLTFILKKKVTVKHINNALIAASKQPRFKGILGVTDQPVVSSDFIYTVSLFTSVQCIGLS